MESRDFKQDSVEGVDDEDLQRQVEAITDYFADLFGKNGYGPPAGTREVSGHGPAGNVPPFNLIPSESPSPCYPVLVALAKGSGRSRFGLNATLRRVREHLIRCRGANRVVVLYTDVWDRKYFKESIGDLTAHRDLGVSFVGYLVTEAGPFPAKIPLG